MPKRSFAPPDAGTARQESTPQNPPAPDPPAPGAEPIDNGSVDTGLVDTGPISTGPMSTGPIDTGQVDVTDPPPVDVPTEQEPPTGPVMLDPPREEPVPDAHPVAAEAVPPPWTPLPPERPTVDERPRTASELTEYTIVRRRSDKPGSGWRRAVHVVSGGVVNPGIGSAEQRRQELALRIRRPLPGPRQIAVASMKGGVGKTTVTAMLGLMLAEHRGDRIVALDANPDAGTLADRLTGRTDSTVRDLLDSLGDVGSLSDVARFTTLSGRLQVLASEQDPARGEAFDRAEYEQVCAVLSRFYNVVVTDSGTGMVHSAMDGTLALANGLVIVGSHTVDGASRAGKTLDWLVAHGHEELVERAIVVLSLDRTSREIDGERLVAYFGERCRAVVVVPRDTHLATGSRIELDKLSPATSDAFLELAALVADDFGGPPSVRHA
jgi:MinD-like ATPase involved in chromosome partitioning or flagellar assembly